MSSDTTLDAAEVSDGELDEFEELADASEQNLELVASVGVLPSVTENEVRLSNGTHRRNTSVACQTEWSWLMCLHKLKKMELARDGMSLEQSDQAHAISGEQEPKSKVERQRSVKEANSRTKQPRSDDAAVKEVASKSPDDVDTNTEHHAGVVDSVAWPSRHDEYGIPVVNEEIKDNLDWSSDESFDDSNLTDEHVEDSEEKKAVVVSVIPDIHESARNDEEAELVGITICGFCGQTIKPFPSLDDQSNLPPEQLYCCSEYQEYVISSLANEENGLSDGQELHNVGHLGVKPSSWRRGMDPQAALSNDMENMETINYQLSARQCLTAGWTIRSVSPLFTETLPDSVEEPVQHRTNVSSKLPKSLSLVMKTYQNGSQFLVIFPDGTGNVFYPSGRVAISIFSTEPSMFSWCVHQDVEQNPGILGLFDSRGSSAVYQPSGQIRLSISPRGGIELNSAGVKRHCWRWKDEKRHVHAPPLYSLTIPLSRHILFQVNSWHDMTLTFSAAQRACRFNVAARRQYAITETEVDIFEDNEEFRKKMIKHFESVLEKTASLLRVPSIGRLTVLPTPRRPATTKSARSARGQTGQQKNRTFVTVSSR